MRSYWRMFAHADVKPHNIHSDNNQGESIRMASKSQCRQQLIEIQKRIVEKLQAEIRSSLKKPSKELLTYREEYESEFKNFRRCSTMAELIAAAARADIIYNGDYHTMAQAQRIPLRILRSLIDHRPRITLALETIRIEHQSILDRFMADSLSEREFLEAIDYSRTWGFPWQNYRDLFTFAKDNAIRVIGINSEGHRGRGALRRRDREAARVIAGEFTKDPERLVYVFDGDLHIAPSHLPREVNEILALQHLHPKTVMIYQNNENIYWELARQGLEQETDVVLLDDDKFCVISTPPIIKFQSYLNWIENTKELASPYPKSWGPEWTGNCDLYSQILELVRVISDFLSIRVDGLDTFTVYSPADLDFLDHLRDQYGLTLSEIRTIAEHIGNNESYFIEKANIIYIANLSVNHAAEEATHFIHKTCAGARRENLSRVEDFYCRVMREALGFFGSKIVNHKRQAPTLDDFVHLRRKHPNKPPEQIDDLRVIGYHMRKHKELERIYLATGKLWRTCGETYQLPLRLHVGLTHVLGYMLGDYIFHGLLKGRLEKSYVRDLFFTNFSDLEESLGTYLTLVEQLSPIESLSSDGRPSSSLRSR